MTTPYDQQTGNDGAISAPLSDSEFRTLVVDYNKSAAPYPSESTIIDLFEAQVRRNPENEAVRLGERSLSYRELNRLADQTASHLCALGVAPEDLVVLFMEHSIDVVSAILGILKAGGAYVPVDPATPTERLVSTLQDISEGGGGALPVLVTQSTLIDIVPPGMARVITTDGDFRLCGEDSEASNGSLASPGGLAYVIYTSGSTGKPKGVMIEHRSLVNYICWACEKYCSGQPLTWPLYSSLAFDLTVTSIFTPLISGGRIVVYHVSRGRHGGAVLDVIADNVAEIVKLTPSHLMMVKEADLHATRVRTIIVGGEDFKTDLACEITRRISHPVEIYNEYGPTEATVGCMIHRYQMEQDKSASVPIGIPAANAAIYILDENYNPVPRGVAGEMYLAGDGLARGYFHRPQLTAERFLTIPDPEGRTRRGQICLAEPRLLRVYKTGDRARWDADGRMEFLGRSDDQVKISGIRIEPGEIEASLLQHPEIDECVVHVTNATLNSQEGLRYCTRCGLASSQPGTTYDSEGVCNVCRDYDSFKDKAEAYFRSRDEFRAIAEQMKTNRTGDYDCLVLLSGGKDSTYMIYQLCGLGLKPLAWTLDNGFLSDEAKENIRSTVQALGVDLIFGTTPHMNEIFVDSLKSFSNVCNGCLKTIYTLSANVAHEKGIRYIITGLSRGQFFETRLSGEVFKRRDFDVNKLDTLILDARKAYHRREDAVSSHLAVDLFRQESIFEDLQFVDFYRFWSAPLDEIYSFLEEKTPWRKPTDTGRSTNCLINDLGIYLHKKQRGFHNYSLPYSWDVRLGQKTREAAMAELDDEIDEARVRALMTQIGYTEPPEAEKSGSEQLVAYYVSEKPQEITELRAFLGRQLPEYMVPRYFVQLPRFPLTPNGKIDRKALPAPSYENSERTDTYVRPQTETEQALAVIWTELLKVEGIGIDDDFFALGGHSLQAIRAASRIRDVFGVELPLQTIFERPTIAGLAESLSEAKGITGKIGRRSGSEESVLSFAQEQLWFLDQLAPGNPVYNIVDFVRLVGPYEPGAIQKAMQELVRRHEILRTVFAHHDGQPVQRVLSEMPISVAEIDLGSLPKQEREREWSRLVRERGRETFDLGRAPLIRAALVHMTGDEHRLLLVLHHIIADEWSQELIQREIVKLYEAFRQGRPSPLPELAIQYADFADWHRSFLRDEILEGQISYWKQELSGASTILELPADKPRPALQSFRGATEVFQLPDNLLEPLKSLSREEHATLFIVLEAAFSALLHRYTDQNDIVVGTPFSGRTQSETENLIGYFVNVIVLRAQFSERLRFRALLRQIRERALGAYAHPNLPIERLVSELAPERDSSRSPLFQVMFILNNPDAVSQVSKVSGNRELDTGTSKFDLTMFLSESGNTLEGMIEYNTDLFEVETVRRMCGHFGALLQAISKDPDQDVAHIPLLSEVERHHQLVSWNGPALSYARDSLVPRAFEIQSAQSPNTPAVRFGSAVVSYAELESRANQLAQALRSRGVGRGDRVGVCLERSADMVAAVLGILKSGAAYVPLDPSFPQDRLRFMAEDAQIAMLVSTTSQAGSLKQPRDRTLLLDADAQRIAAFSDSRLPVDRRSAQGEDPAYVIYTSGSTGQPKGVVVPHRAVVNFLASMACEPGLGAADVLVAVTTLSFDIAVLELFLPLTAGATVVVASHDESLDGVALRRLLEQCGATILQATPATWRLLLEAGWDGGTGFKALVGGEALPVGLADRMLARGIELWNMYGPTETTVWSTCSRVTSTSGGISIGRPIANTVVRVLDSYGNLCPIGVPGELVIGGDGVTLGYWNRPELTAERFIADPYSRAQDATLYRTGDRARWREDGTLEHLGRLDFQVKLRGYRIELGEIETLLSRHPAVREVAVTAREDSGGEQCLVAYVVSETPPDDLVDQLRALLRVSLPEYMVPAYFVNLHALPLTPNGKLDRRALPDPGNRSRQQGTYVAPRTATEAFVAGIWGEVLGLDRVGVEDNFFEVGGHSLLAARLMLRLTAESNLNVPLRNLFERPTVAGLSEIMDMLSWMNEVPSLAADADSREEITL